MQDLNISDWQIQGDTTGKASVYRVTRNDDNSVTLYIHGLTPIRKKRSLWSRIKRLFK